MYKDKKILAVVPARSGSKGLPHKNIKKLNGKSLIKIAGECLSYSKYVDCAIISSDSREYIEEGVLSGLDAPFIRPISLSLDSSTAVDTILHAVKEAEKYYNLSFDVVLIIEPTSPMRIVEDIDNCINKLLEGSYYSVIAVSKADKKYHPKKALVLNNENIKLYDSSGVIIANRQELDDLYYRNGVCYAIDVSYFKENKKIFSDNTSFFIIDRPIVNIDDELDFMWAEFLISQLSKDGCYEKIKICTVLVDRANYGRLKPVLLELKNRDEVELNLLCSGTMLLERFGYAKDILVRDGFKIDEEVYMELEGASPGTMAKSIGLGIIEFSTAFRKLNPDFVLLIGDRYEALSATISAVYQNICLIHIQGGEVSGSIDESARHAITKFAHYHFPATERSGKYIIAMGEDPKTVYPLGCPSVDVVLNTDLNISNDYINSFGVGKEVDINEPYILVVFHPVTTEYLSAEHQMEKLLEAVIKTGKQVLLLWPNSDAGSDRVSQAIRRYREFHPDANLRVFKNFQPEEFIQILKGAECAVGNSSSFIRDASFVGIPIVLVGSRQDGRERAEHVIRVDAGIPEIYNAICKQIKHGKYEPSKTYGVPGVSKQIVDKIVRLKPYQQKMLHYVSEE